MIFSKNNFWLNFQWRIFWRIFITTWKKKKIFNQYFSRIQKIIIMMLHFFTSCWNWIKIIKFPTIDEIIWMRKNIIRDDKISKINMWIFTVPSSSPFILNIPHASKMKGCWILSTIIMFDVFTNFNISLSSVFLPLLLLYLMFSSSSRILLIKSFDKSLMSS